MVSFLKKFHFSPSGYLILGPLFFIFSITVFPLGLLSALYVDLLFLLSFKKSSRSGFVLFLFFLPLFWEGWNLYYLLSLVSCALSSGLHILCHAAYDQLQVKQQNQTEERLRELQKLLQAQQFEINQERELWEKNDLFLRKELQQMRGRLESQALEKQEKKETELIQERLDLLNQARIDCYQWHILALEAEKKVTHWKQQYRLKSEQLDRSRRDRFCLEQTLLTLQKRKEEGREKENREWKILCRDFQQLFQERDRQEKEIIALEQILQFSAQETSRPEEGRR
jgi:hypothetical protein